MPPENDPVEGDAPAPVPTPAEQPDNQAPANGQAGQPAIDQPVLVNPFVTPQMMGIPMGALQGLQVAQLQVWQGQFPPPEAIERYELVHAGTFDRIIGMAERAQQANIDAARDTRHRTSLDIRWGQILGAIVALSAIGAAVYVALHNHPGVAATIIGAGVMTVAIALISGAHNKASIPQIPTTPPPPKSETPEE